MSLKQEINSAIATHSMWKSRLHAAINTGVLDVSAETITKDDQCPFGRWLQTVEPSVRDSEEYKRVKELHAKFHVAAAKVVELALAGKKNEAEQLMGVNGEYAVITTKLVMELMAWEKKAS